MPNELYHHSRLLRCRRPQGAMKAGETVTLRLYADKAYSGARVTLRAWVNEQEQRIPMQVLKNEEGARGETIFEAPLQVSATPGWVWYSFVVERPGEEPLYYGGESGEGQCYANEPPAYQITVYNPAFAVPRWFRAGLMYQIFPDRFCRGRAHNAGVDYHRQLGRRLRIHKNWEEAPYYLPGENESHYVPDDFFLGDLAGIREKLPYLQSLGVTCLYLNPVFESYSNHRYDAADYKRIDPLLGDNEEFRALCADCAARGMNIMLDGVFSHTGADSRYFNKYGRYADTGAFQSNNSPYRAWYDFQGVEGTEYRAWWGFPELPEVNEMHESYLSFVIGDEHSLLRHWADYGASSWRLDVADELPDAFIKRMKARLKTIDPESVLLGEVWEDASRKEAYGVRREYVQGDALDSVMNYPFKNAVLAFLTGGITAHALNDILQTQCERYPQPFYYAAMNLLSSHDSMRALTVLGGAPDAQTLTREAQAVYTLKDAQAALAKQRMVCATALQMAAVGVPSIYYGDEAGAFGMADPFNRSTYPWGKEDEHLLHAVRQLAALRRASPALSSGFSRMCAVSAELFAVLRYTANGKDAFMEEAAEDVVLLLVNRSALPVHVRISPDDFTEGPHSEVPVSFTGTWKNALTNETIQSGERFEAVLPGTCAWMLRKT